MTDYDAIVIGAGNGGLTAATALQRGGAKTLLLERHNIPGGCATSFVRGEFEFEVALHQLSGLGTEKNPFIMRKIFADLGVMDKVEFVEEGELYRILVNNGEKTEVDVTLPASWTGIHKELKKHFPDESVQIDAFLKLCADISLESFMGLPRARKQKDEALLKSSCPNYVKYGLKDLKSVLDEFFNDEQIKTVLAAYWCYVGLPPSQIAFIDLAVMLYCYGAFKPWHIVGGSQALSSALLESFLDAGGEVRFNCAVDKILTSETSGTLKATGIRTEFGEELKSNWVVSNASSVLTYGELLDTPTMPKEIQQDFKSRQIGTSAFCLYIGLDKSPAQLGIKNASTFMCNTNDEELMHDTMSTMNDPVATMLTCYNVDDPSFAPPGKSQISLLCLQYGQVWEDVSADDYAQTKYKFADVLIDQAEKIFPGIRDSIEEIEVATPLTMMRYLNTPGGAIYGFRQNPEDSVLYRDPYKSVENLAVVGSWNGTGGFQPTYMAGPAIARKVIKSLNSQKSEVAHV
jgi:phytoene dehydrogenase-like protein